MSRKNREEQECCTGVSDKNGEIFIMEYREKKFKSGGDKGKKSWKKENAGRNGNNGRDVNGKTERNSGIREEKMITGIFFKCSSSLISFVSLWPSISGISISVMTRLTLSYRSESLCICER